MLLQVVLTHHAAVEPAVLDSICASLHKAGLQERAGDLYLHLGRQEEALAAYRKGHAFRCGSVLPISGVYGILCAAVTCWLQPFMEERGAAWLAGVLRPRNGLPLSTSLQHICQTS
jgi:hypothetical protein